MRRPALLAPSGFAAAVGVLALVVSGCGSTTPNAAAQESVTPVITRVPTASPSSSPTPTMQPGTQNSCGPFQPRHAYVQAISTRGHEEWRTSLPAVANDDVSAQNTPVVTAGRVIVAQAGVHALDETDGRLAWSWGAGKSVYAVWLDGDRVVVLTDQVGADAAVTALDVSDGHEVWRQAIPTGGLLGNVVHTSSGRLAWVRADGAVQVLDLADGKLLWSHPMSRSPALIALGGNVIFAASGRVTAWDEASGSPVWTVGGAAEDPALVAVGDRAILLAGSSGPRIPTAFSALDPTSGATLWRYDYGASVFSVSGLPGHVLTYDLMNQLQSLDAGSGKLTWQMKAPRSNLETPPVVLADRFVDAEGGNGNGKSQVVARSTPTGGVLWAAPTPGYVFGVQPLLATQGLVVVQSAPGGSYGSPSTLTAYRADSGKVAWSAQVATDAQAPTAVDGSTLFVHSADPGQACAS